MPNTPRRSPLARDRHGGPPGQTASPLPPPLALSCALNAVFAISLVMVLGTDWFPEVDRSREQCGGHGMLYEGADECECFDCWSGPFCAEKLEGDACVTTNQARPFSCNWVRHPEARTSILPSYHLAGHDCTCRVSSARHHHSTLHKMVGNAEVDGREIVIGIGSTELISAAMYALSGELRDTVVHADGDRLRLVAIAILFTTTRCPPHS